MTGSDRDLEAAPPVRHLLAATDFSEGADAAVARAHMLARLHGARLTLLHAVPRDVGTDMHAIAWQALDQRAAELEAPYAGVKVVIGSAGTAITEAAEELGADLIVIGAHGEHWLKDLFIGSTAETVADNGRSPVLLVKHASPEPYERALVAVDLSDGAETVARDAMRLTPGPRHRLAHVAVVIGENLLLLNGATSEDLDELRRAQVEQALPKVESLADRLGLDRPIVIPGHAEQRVPQLASDLDADLLAVGTTHQSRLGRALLGSVVRSSVNRAPCDVLIVHTREADS